MEARKVRNRRLALGIGQQRLASLALMGMSSLSRIETGRRPATADEMRRIETVLATLEEAQVRAIALLAS